jgi:hypothetical protein
MLNTTTTTTKDLNFDQFSSSVLSISTQIYWLEITAQIHPTSRTAQLIGFMVQNRNCRKSWLWHLASI